MFTDYFYVFSVLSLLLVMEVLIQSQDMILSCLENPIMAPVCLLLINLWHCRLRDRSTLNCRS